MVMQFVMTGLLKHLKGIEQGPAIIARAFDFASDVATMYATKENSTKEFTLAVGMVDHWRKTLKI